MARFSVLVLVFSCFCIFITRAVQQPIVTRITEDAIGHEEDLIARAHEKNAVLRKTVRIGALAGAACGAVALMYAIFTSRKVPERSAATAARTLEEALVEITHLKGQVADIISKKNGPPFGSYAWIQSHLINFALSPVVIIDLLGVGRRVGTCLEDIFYPLTLAWFIRARTNIGSLAVERVDGAHEKERQQAATAVAGGSNIVLVPGVLMREIEHSAAALDDAATKNDETVDSESEYRREIIVANFNRLLDDLARVIAFMRYKVAGDTMAPAVRREAADRALYMLTLSNKTAAMLEQELGRQQRPASPALLALVRKFFAEIGYIFAGFVLLERSRERHHDEAT